MFSLWFNFLVISLFIGCFFLSSTFKRLRWERRKERIMESVLERLKAKVVKFGY